MSTGKASVPYETACLNLPEKGEEDGVCAIDGTRPKRSTRGIIFILLGSFSFSAMFLCVKFLADTNTFVLVFYRSIIQCAISFTALIVGWMNRKRFQHTATNPYIPLRQVLLGPPDCETRFYLAVRGGFGASAICAFYYGIQHMPLSDAVTLQFTTPPFAAAFAVCLVGEPWVMLDKLGAVVCLLGVALIAHPTGLFGDQSNPEEVIAEADPQQTSAVFVTLAGAAMAGLAYVSVRKIGHKAPAMVMVWIDGVLCLPIVLLSAGLFEGTMSVWKFDRELSVTDAVLILLMGVSAFGGQWFTNLGLQEEAAATATLATTTQIVWTYIFNLLMLAEPLNGWSLSGTGLILGYMLVVAVIKSTNSTLMASECLEGTSTTGRNYKEEFEFELLATSTPRREAKAAEFKTEEHDFEII